MWSFRLKLAMFFSPQLTPLHFSWTHRPIPDLPRMEHVIARGRPLQCADGNSNRLDLPWLAAGPKRNLRQHLPSASPNLVGSFEVIN
jgi:hypothetical protein